MLRLPTRPASWSSAWWWSAGALLVLAQLALRAWVLGPSFFFTDDFRLLLDARERSGSFVAYVLTPFDAQLMPGGRALVAAVAAAGPTSWPWAVAGTLGLQLVASLACWWMLTTWFGRRPAVVALLALYLFSPITVPATTWWAASLNQLPLQVSLFATLALAARYLREPSWRSLLPMTAALAVGLLFYVKTVLVVVVLAGLALGWFSRGGGPARLRTAVRRHHHALLLGGGVAAGYAALYLTQVPQAVEGTWSWRVAVDLADSMLGTSLLVGLVGGPWTWLESNPPLVLVEPAWWARVAAQAVVAVVVLVSCLVFRRSGRAWLLLLAYAIGCYLLLLVTRAQLFGGVAGQEYRYLTDVACVLPLCLGLAVLPVAGALEHAERRDGTGAGRAVRWVQTTLAAVPRRTRAAAAPVLVVLVVLGGVVSTLTYASYWHRDNLAATWVPRLQESVAGRPLDLADQLVPARVMPAYTQPDDRASRLVPLLSPGVRFPVTTDVLGAIREDGSVGPVEVAPVTRSTQRQSETCALVAAGPAGVELPLEEVAGADPDPPVGEALWLRVGYLASAGTTADLTNGIDRVEVTFREGLHDLWVRVSGATPGVRLAGVAPGVSVCLDDVVVGPLRRLG